MFDLNSYLEGIIKKDTSNVMSSLLWLNGLVTLPCLLGSFYSNGPYRYCLILLSLVIIAYTLFKYEYWSNKDPRLLMSEHTQIEMAKLDIIQEKGGEIKFETIDIPLGEAPKKLAPVEEGH